MPFFTLKVEMVEWHSRYGESATCVVSASWWFISFDPLSSPRIPFVCVPSFSIHLSSFDMKGVCASPKQRTREWKIVRFVLLNCFFMSPQKKRSPIDAHAIFHVISQHAPLAAWVANNWLCLRFYLWSHESPTMDWQQNAFGLEAI